MFDRFALRDRSRIAAAVLLGSYAALFPFAGTKGSIALAAPLLLIPITLWTIATPGRWIGAFLAAAILLPPLPFPIGDSGPHPALFLAAVGLLSGMLRLDSWVVRADVLSASLALLFGVLLISIIPAAAYSGPVIAAASFARVCLFGISVYLFLYARGTTGQTRWVRLLFVAAVAAAGFACLDFYFQFPAPAGFGPQFVWLSTGVYRRAQGLFYEASTLGNFCVFFLVMIGASMLQDRPRGWGQTGLSTPVASLPLGQTGQSPSRPVSRALLIFGGVVLSVALVLSYSRASLVSLCVSVLALLCLNVSRLKTRRVAVLLFLVLPASLASVIALFPQFAQLYWLRLSASAQYFFYAPEVVLSGRVATWKTLFDFIAQNPWHLLLGVGYKTLPYASPVGRPIVADNMYLSILLETGIFGLGGLLLFCGAALRASYRAARSQDRSRSFFGAWFFCFWAGQMFQMMSGDLLTYWRVLPVYFWVLAMAVRK